ncbi:hypothetical protein [Billgrantia gudaonensis]|uniref:Uncharacterized protein n=1 Tax=Billgrantia gudaonensis TaxID=376427 RepID=A0A1G8N3N9_9GAMM|nr:hypothetical protein [Halomonas gudaonensis]SDI74687.1 hypothetical protein SAMN04487954_101213 [Halomonas gudaonensis]
MLTSNSMTLLWLTYLGLSLVVLLTGYLGLAFVPRVLRLPITWAVAGVLWIPTRFRLPLLEEGEFYTGMAPAVVVASVAFLESNADALLSSGLLVGAGAGLGVALGLLQWWARRRSDEAPAESASRPRRDGSGTASAGQGRREPMIG